LLNGYHPSPLIGKHAKISRSFKCTYNWAQRNKRFTKDQLDDTPVHDVAVLIGLEIRRKARDLRVVENKSVTTEQLEEIWMNISMALDGKIAELHGEACESDNNGKAIVREHNAEAITKIRSALFNSWQKEYGIFPGCPIYKSTS